MTYQGRWSVVLSEVNSTVSNAVTLAGSAVLLLALVDQTVFSLIGSTKSFLFVAGLTGVFHALVALVNR